MNITKFDVCWFVGMVILLGTGILITAWGNGWREYFVLSAGVVVGVLWAVGWKRD